MPNEELTATVLNQELEACTMTQEEQFLRAIQATILKELRGYLGTHSEDPLLKITHVLGSIYEQYSGYGLCIYDGKNLLPRHTEQGIMYAFLVRIGHGHCSSAHYLYGKVEMEHCADDKWLIHSVTVKCKPVPDVYRTSDELARSISDARRAFDKLHLMIRSVRGFVNTLDYDGTITRTLEFLDSKILHIWSFTKWHEPWIPRDVFISSGLTSYLEYERYKKVQFKEGEDGELIVEFYYKGELILAHKIHLSESLEDLL